LNGARDDGGEGGKMKQVEIAQLDKHYPPCGPCAFCGHLDKRHRLWDAILDRIEAGESEQSIADDFEISMECLHLIKMLRPYK